MISIILLQLNNKNMVIYKFVRIFVHADVSVFPKQHHYPGSSHLITPKCLPSFFCPILFILKYTSFFVILINQNFLCNSTLCNERIYKYFTHVFRKHHITGLKRYKLLYSIIYFAPRNQSASNLHELVFADVPYIIICQISPCVS